MISAGGTTSRVAAGGIFPNSGGVFPNLSTKLKTTAVMPKLRPMSVKSAPDPEIVQEKKHKCDKCSAQYQQRSSLKAHMRICGLSKNFKCKLCDNAYAEQRGLDKHFKDIHASHHPCEYCTLAFKTPEALEFHLYRIHKCKSCGKIFSDVMGLKSHVVCEIKGDVTDDDHETKVKNSDNIVERKKDFYRCHSLEKTMAADGKMALEQQKIISEKKKSSSTFSCKLCPKIEKSEDALKSHMYYLHHIKSMEVCNKCNLKFTDRLEFKNHTCFLKEESVEIKGECFDIDDEEDIIISDDNLDDEVEEPNVEEILP